MLVQPVSEENKNNALINGAQASRILQKNTCSLKTQPFRDTVSSVSVDKNILMPFLFMVRSGRELY